VALPFLSVIIGNQQVDLDATIATL